MKKVYANKMPTGKIDLTDKGKKNLDELRKMFEYHFQDYNAKLISVKEPKDAESW